MHVLSWPTTHPCIAMWPTTGPCIACGCNLSLHCLSLCTATSSGCNLRGMGGGIDNQQATSAQWHQEESLLYLWPTTYPCILSGPPPALAVLVILQCMWPTTCPCLPGAHHRFVLCLWPTIPDRAHHLQAMAVIVLYRTRHAPWMRLCSCREGWLGLVRI